MLKDNASRRSKRKQRGAAGIYLGLALIPVLSMTFLAIEGTRYVQTQNRLGDAAEAAAFAVALQARGTSPSSNDKVLSEFAKHYIREYVQDSSIDDDDFLLEIKLSKDNPEQGFYDQYRVDVKTTHQSWYSSEWIPSFQRTEKVGNTAIARNYPELFGGKEADLIFISDFSGSMNSNGRIQSLKKAIKDISTGILSTNDGDKMTHRIGFVPFNLRTVEQYGDKTYCKTYLEYNDNVPTGGGYVPYGEVDWMHWATQQLSTASTCANSIFGWTCNGADKAHAKMAYHIASSDGIGHRGIPDHLHWVDLDKTLESLFIENKDLYSGDFDATNVKLFGANKGFCLQATSNGRWADFESIELTDNQSEIDRVQTMHAAGWTSAYQGILGSTKMMMRGRPKDFDQLEDEAQERYNKRIKMFLIISDGEENPWKDTLEKLVDKGMCTKMLDYFTHDENSPAYMGVIGLDFKASDHVAFKKCVGEDNIIDIDNADDLLDAILDMLQSGSGGAQKMQTKLHYRFSEVNE
ncbi:VWA domain-containing protein [Vibrio cholerae]